MVKVAFEARFEKDVRKIKNNSLKDKVKKQIKKIISAPTMGKPMRYTRKGTRQTKIPPFRLSYQYMEKEDKIIFLSLYHKDQQ